MVILLAGLMTADSIIAAGISIDAGLTPAEGRWMARVQHRVFRRENSAGAEMTMRMSPVIVAHGLKSNITLIARQAIVSRKMVMPMGDLSNSGFGDLLFLAKYRLYRKNTASYTFGIAPTIGVEIPIGEKQFSSDSWDLHTGCLFSGRTGRWGIDLNLKYVWNGIDGYNDNFIDPGDETVVETAVDYRFGFGANSEYSLAPVLELAYNHTSDDQIDPNGVSGGTAESPVVGSPAESVMFVSPGFVFTRSSFIIEALIRVPVWDDLAEGGMEHQTGFLIGVRLMN